MKLLSYGKDGGPESTVWGFWFIEIKSLFSIAILRFENGSREAFHSHAFNAVSWILKGILCEQTMLENNTIMLDLYGRSLRPIVTPRDRLHRVSSNGRTWVFTVRGPWKNTWQEFLPAEGKFITLTHGRKPYEELSTLSRKV